VSTGPNKELIPKFSLADIGDIPFGSILRFVWKWMWATFIAAIPIALIIWTSIYLFSKATEEEKPSYRYGEKPSYFNY